MKKLPHGAIWTAIVFQQIFGFLWYSPVLFLNRWLTGQGKTLSDLNSSNPEPFVIGIVCSIVFTYGFALLLRQLNVFTLKKGWQLGGFVSMSFSVTELVAHYRFLQISWTTIAIDCISVLIIAHVTAGLIARSLGKSRE